VTDWGCSPMMTVEENLFYFGKVFEEPTTEEVKQAITSLRSVFTVVRAVQK
jgi:ABC-type Na+ transport system ATPase subunit NatA